MFKKAPGIRELPLTIGRSSLERGMQSRNVDGDRQETQADVARRIAGRPVDKHAWATPRSAVATQTEAAHPSDHSIKSSSSGGASVNVLSAEGHGLAGESTDDVAAFTILARPENVCQTPEQDAKLQAAGQLAGSVAHDFNNIFTAVLGNLQLVQRHAADNHHVQQMVGAAIEASLRGTDLANRLLTFSQRRELDSQVCDFNTLLTGMEKVLQRTVGRRIEICTKLMEGLWKVEADPAHLEAAILNLAINAREAMPEGGTLTIETANIAFDDLAAWLPVLGAHNYVRISVHDTGCGMAHELIESIFEPFFTTKLPHRHAGLGLIMVSAFVEQSRGLLTVDSAPGKGTSFNFFLPAEPAAASTTANEGGSDASSPTERV